MKISPKKILWRNESYDMAFDVLRYKYVPACKISCAPRNLKRKYGRTAMPYFRIVKRAALIWSKING